MNTSNVSVTLNIEGTSRFKQGTHGDKPSSDEIPFHFESTDIWTAYFRGSLNRADNWGPATRSRSNPGYKLDTEGFTFRRRCYVDDPSGSRNESVLYIFPEYGPSAHPETDGGYSRWLRFTQQIVGTVPYDTFRKWFLSIESFGVTPIQKGNPSPIGRCHTPRPDRQGVSASFGQALAF